MKPFTGSNEEATNILRAMRDFVAFGAKGEKDGRYTIYRSINDAIRGMENLYNGHAEEVLAPVPVPPTSLEARAETLIAERDTAKDDGAEWLPVATMPVGKWVEVLTASGKIREGRLSETQHSIGINSRGNITVSSKGYGTLSASQWRPIND